MGLFCTTEIALACYLRANEAAEYPYFPSFKLLSVSLNAIQGNAEKSTKGESAESKNNTSKEDVTEATTHEKDTNNGS